MLVSIASAGLAVIALVAAPHSMSVLNMVPRDVLQVVGTGGIVGAIGAFIAAMATGLRARGSTIPRPDGFPVDHCAEVPRLINAYNVLKEAARLPNQIEEGAEQFAVDLYLKAVGRKPIDAQAPQPRKPAETQAHSRQTGQHSPPTAASMPKTMTDTGQLPTNLLAPRPVKPRSQPAAPYAKPQQPPAANSQDQAKGKSTNPPWSDKSGGQSKTKPKRES